MDLQLYDYKTDSLLIDSLFISDNVNNYLTFSCEDISLNCFTNNSIMNTYGNIINNLLLHSSKPKQIIDLRKAQNNILVKMLKNIYNKDMIVNILKEQKDKNNLDSNVKIENIFFAVNNDSITKFIAFFNNDLHYNNSYSSSENYHRITTYSLNAEKYQDRWYFEKPCMISNETKSNDIANENLICSEIRDSYFNVNDTNYNNEFWDVGQFEKVEDITKTEKWNLYRELYENEEVRYRKYIGLTRFIADELIKIEEEKLKVKE